MKKTFNQLKIGDLIIKLELYKNDIKYNIWKITDRKDHQNSIEFYVIDEDNHLMRIIPIYGHHKDLSNIGEDHDLYCADIDESLSKVQEIIDLNYNQIDIIKERAAREIDRVQKDITNYKNNLNKIKIKLGIYEDNY